MNSLRSILALTLLNVPLVHAAPQANRSAAQVVASMYHDFIWETQPDSVNRQDVLIEQPRKVLERYFDVRLTSLILADRKCVGRNQSNCSIDFDPIWDSQDPQGTTAEVSAGNTPDAVVVALTYPGTAPRNTKLLYRMVKTDAGWRIADIRYPDGAGFTLLSLFPAK